MKWYSPYLVNMVEAMLYGDIPQKSSINFQSYFLLPTLKQQGETIQFTKIMK